MLCRIINTLTLAIMHFQKLELPRRTLLVRQFLIPPQHPTARLSQGSVEKQEENDPFNTPERQASVHCETEIDAPLLNARLAGEDQSLRSARTTDTHASVARWSANDWIVPVEEKVCSMLMVLVQLCANRPYLLFMPIRRLSARECLQPTVDVAKAERRSLRIRRE